MKGMFPKLAASCMLAITCSPYAAMAATAVQIYQTGADCPTGSKLSKPYSVTFINVDEGEVTHVEYVDCDGNRTVGCPSTGIMSGYHAYRSFLYTDNVPLVNSGPANSLVVSLTTPAKIEVRDGATGTLLASYPSSGPQSSVYTVSSSVLSGYSGKLIVVDVIRTSDNSYRGTASYPYGI